MEQKLWKSHTRDTRTVRVTDATLERCWTLDGTDGYVCRTM